MARSYRHIQQYEKNGPTKREIKKLLGFNKEQLHNFVTRYNEKQK